MAIERRHAECPRCRRMLMVDVEEELIGSTVGIHCWECGNTFQGMFTPQDSLVKPESMSDAEWSLINPLLERLRKKMREVILANPKLSDIVCGIREEGFEPFFEVVSKIGLDRCGDEPPAVGSQPSIAKDGKFLPGAITADDEAFLPGIRNTSKNQP